MGSDSKTMSVGSKMYFETELIGGLEVYDRVFAWVSLRLELFDE